MASGGEEGLRSEDENGPRDPVEMLSKQQQERLQLLIKFKKEAISLLLSAVQEGRTQREFEQDYFDFTGKYIPHSELGYNSVEELINGCPDAIEIRSFGHFKAPRLYPIITSQVSHLAQLIQQQKPSRVTRIGGVLPIHIQRIKVYENIMSIVARKGENRLLAISKFKEEYSRIYGENLESSVQRLFNRSLVDYLKEEMNYDVDLFERDNLIYVQKKKPLQDNWDTMAYQQQQRPQDLFVWNTQAPPQPFQQQHWGMASPSWPMVPMTMPMPMPMFQQPATAMPFLRYPVNVFPFDNQMMGPRPWTPGVMVPPLLMASMSPHSPNPAVSCAMTTPPSSSTSASFAGAMKEIPVADENEQPTGIAEEQNPAAPTIERVVDTIRAVLTASLNGVHSFDLPRMVCDRLGYFFTPLHLFDLTWYQLLKHYLGDEVEIMSLSFDHDGPSTKEFLVRQVRAKPDETQQSRQLSTTVVNSAALNHRVNSEDMMDQIERELATPPSSSNEAICSAAKSAGIDVDESVDQHRQRVLDSFPDANELMIMLLRVFRQAPADGILFSEFDNTCRQVLGFPLTYSQYDMWGPSDLMDHELITVEQTTVLPTGNGPSVPVLRVFPGRVLQRQQSQTTVYVPAGLPADMYRLLRAEDAPMVIEQLEDMLKRTVKDGRCVRREIIRAMIENPRLFSCFIPSLGEVLRHRLFIRLNEDLNEDDVVLLRGRI